MPANVASHGGKLAGEEEGKGNLSRRLVVACCLALGTMETSRKRDDPPGDGALLHDASLSHLNLKRIRIDNSTPTANSIANETNDAQAESSSPPALGSFVSMDSSETSSDESASLGRAAYAPLAENESGKPPREGRRGPAVRGHEYYSAIHAARERLRLAETTEANSREQLQRALGDHERSKQEVQSASAFLDQVEERWGVVDLVHTVAGSADEIDGADRGEVVDPPVTRTVASSANQDRSTDVELIQVSQAGEGIVNGTYRLVQGVGMGPVYVHSEGPVEILEAQYDLCIYRRTGYGDRIRWCVALVPTRLAKSDRGRMEVGKGGERRELELAQAYIYYWIELHATALNCASPPTGADSKRWGVCHGEKPLPVLKDVTERRRWWHFWR